MNQVPILAVRQFCNFGASATGACCLLNPSGKRICYAACTCHSSLDSLDMPAIFACGSLSRQLSAVPRLKQFASNFFSPFSSSEHLLLARLTAVNTRACAQNGHFAHAHHRLDSRAWPCRPPLPAPPPSALPVYTPKDRMVCCTMSAHSRSCASVITSGGANRMMFFCGRQPAHSTDTYSHHLLAEWVNRGTQSPATQSAFHLIGPVPKPPTLCGHASALPAL